jgi:hypothetical protein
MRFIAQFEVGGEGLDSPTRRLMNTLRRYCSGSQKSFRLLVLYRGVEPFEGLNEVRI